MRKIFRLRARAAPIRLFGESDKAALRRLRKLEMEQPELKEGWKNEFQKALTEVDNDLVVYIMLYLHLVFICVISKHLSIG